MQGRTSLVYLAGPILGQTYGQATDWRQEASRLLGHSVECLSPMRGKEELSDLESMPGSWPSSLLTTARGIVSRDRFDVQRCDLVLMNLAGAERVSLGSMVELGWATAFGKPVVVVLPGGVGNPHWHPFVLELASIQAPTLDHAVRVVLSMLNA